MTLKTEVAISTTKDLFTEFLCNALNLKKVSCPLFVESVSGLNDDLTGEERAVDFTTKSGLECSVVQSLAKWKRFYLSKHLNELKKTSSEDTSISNDSNVTSAPCGIVTDMHAIRKDEDLSPLHSYFVDQWDWEIVIQKEDRTVETLKKVVIKIYDAILELEDRIAKLYSIPKCLPLDITFLTTQSLEDDYPLLSPAEREYQATKKHGAVFMIGIGGLMDSGIIHDHRAPDYDDWELNGDILVHYDPLDCVMELSSMGVRVSEESLIKQLKTKKEEYKKEMMFHKMLLAGELPYTIGGGIGQSRLVMFMLKKNHIGEVQSSVWDEQTVKENKGTGVKLL